MLQEDYNNQNTANNNEWSPYLATLAMSTLGGGIIGGPTGAVAGLLYSMLDERLMEEGILDKHYLTSAAYWSSTSFTPAAHFISKFFPAYSFMFHFAASAFAVVMPKFTDDFLDYKKKVGVPIDSFIAVNRFFDKEGAFSQQELEKITDKFFEEPGQAFGLLKDKLIEQYDHNPFLKTFVQDLGLSVVEILINLIFLNYLANYNGNMFTYAISNRLNMLPEGAGHSSLTDAIAKLYTIPTKIKGAFAVSESLTMKNKLYSIAGNLYSLVATPKQPTTGAEVAWEGVKVFTAFLMKLYADSVIGEMKRDILYQQFDLLTATSVATILEEDNGKKINAHKEGDQILQNLNHDLYELLFSGVIKLSSEFSNSLQALVALKTISKIAPDALGVWYAINLLVKQSIIATSTRETLTLSKEQGKLSNKVWTIGPDIAANIKSIGLRDGEKFAEDQYFSPLSKSNDITKTLAANVFTKNMQIAISERIVSAMEALYFYFKWAKGNMDIEKIPVILSTAQTIDTYLSSNLNYAAENTGLILSLERIKTLFDIIEVENNSAVIRTTNTDNKIILSDYHLMQGKKTLVAIDEYAFELGKHYVITGASGCGKTSVLTDIKEGIFGGLASNGQISLPVINGKDAKIMFLNQELYLPQESTLFEAIYYPNILAKLSKEEQLALKEKVISLLKEIRIDSDMDDPNNNKGVLARLNTEKFELSGGQKKKIAFVSAILHQPDILILDEALNGLDQKSVANVERMLNKYLPHVTILSVDHHPEDNNYNGFFEKEVHFANGTISESPAVTKLYDYNEINASGENVEIVNPLGLCDHCFS